MITRLRKYPIDPKAYLGRCIWPQWGHKTHALTLLHSEWPELYGVQATLSALG